MEGGTIALVKQGDTIELDIPARRITLKVSDKELKRGRALLEASGPKIKKGWLSRYAKVVTSANTGAVVRVTDVIVTGLFTISRGS